MQNQIVFVLHSVFSIKPKKFDPTNQTTYFLPEIDCIVLKKFYALKCYLVKVRLRQVSHIGNT